MRWLFFFVVFVMPVQFAWSAAAVYCQHETSPASFHVGHHEHKHPGADGLVTNSVASTDADSKSPPSPHSDCGFCHASVAQTPLVALSVLETPTTQEFEHPRRELYAYRIEPDIDRPKWRSAS